MSNKLHQVLQLIDSANNKDPNIELDDNGVSTPKERLYSERMTAMLDTYSPSASDHLKIAAHAQHIERWILPRSKFPEGRAGYLTWRREQGAYHANRSGELMMEAGYADSDIERTKALVQKQGIKRDPEAQTLEDVICLVFLKYYFAPFTEKHSEEKVIDIVRKTWNKMSKKGQHEALSLPLNKSCSNLVKKALASN